MKPYRTHPGITALKESGKYSDLTLKCGDQTFKVHRAQICPQSEYFSAICDSTFKEAQAGVIELQDDDPEHVALMVTYLYEFNYDDCPIPEKAQSEVELLRTELSEQRSEDQAGDLLDINNRNNLTEGLELIRDLLIQQDTSTWEDILGERQRATTNAQYTNVAMYALGEKYLISELKDLAVEKFTKQNVEHWKDSMHDIIREVYSTTPSTDRGLRDPLVAIYVQEFDPENPEEQEYLKELPEAQIDILRAALSIKKTALKEYVTLAHSLQRQNETTKRELARALERMTHEKNIGLAVWNRLQNRLDSLLCCRHCAAGFNLLLDETESRYENAKIVLRCRGCRTRHSNN